jgi:hypothetical protein
LNRLAGAGGFEPPHGGTKIRCLTAWLRPNVLGSPALDLYGAFAGHKCGVEGNEGRTSRHCTQTAPNTLNVQTGDVRVHCTQQFLVRSPHGDNARCSTGYCYRWSGRNRAYTQSFAQAARTEPERPNAALALAWRRGVAGLGPLAPLPPWATPVGRSRPRTCRRSTIRLVSPKQPAIPVAA